MSCQIIFRNPEHSGGGCIFADPTIIIPIDLPGPVGDGGNGGGQQQPGYSKTQNDALLETRRNRILREDDDIIALIMSMLTKDLL